MVLTTFVQIECSQFFCRELVATIFEPFLNPATKPHRLTCRRGTRDAHRVCPRLMYTPDLSDTEMELESMSARSSFGSARSSISGGRRSSTGSMARTPLGVVDNFQRRVSIGISFDNVSQMKKNTNGDLACVVAKRANLDEVQAEKDEVLAQRGLEERARPSAWLLRMRAVLV